MSGFKEHVLAGTVTGVIVGAVTGYYSGSVGFGISNAIFVLIGSQLPDIDTVSIPSRIFAWLTIVFSGVMMYLGEHKQAAISGILYAAFSCDKHRGWKHGWPLIICCFVAAFLSTKNILPNYYFLLAPLALGLISHKFLDK